MAEADLLKRIRDLEDKHERLRAQIVEWMHNEEGAIRNLQRALERVEGRLKDLDKIEEVAYRAYAATHADAHLTIWAVNKVLDEASTRIARRHETTLSKRDDDATM